MTEIRNKVEEFFTNMEEVVSHHKFTYSGKGVSTNDYYKSSHWTKRNKLVEEYHWVIKSIIGKKLQGKKFDRFSLIIFYNSRHDPDNVVGFGKIFVDVLNKELNLIEEDNKHIYKAIACIPDVKLKHNTFEFLLLEMK